MGNGPGSARVDLAAGRHQAEGPSPPTLSNSAVRRLSRRSNISLQPSASSSTIWLWAESCCRTRRARCTGRKYLVKRGKTSILTGDQARQLLDSIDATELCRLREGVLIGVVVYSFARVSAGSHDLTRVFGPANAHLAR
jgi:hypothetical protein